MSQYASRDDLVVNGLPEEAITGIADDDINRILQEASAKCDSYLTGRYVVPRPDWGSDLTGAAAKIAAWDLLVHRRGVNPSDPGHAAIMKDRNDAMAWLKDVAKDVANLVVGDAAGKPRRGVAAFVGGSTSGSRGW